MSLEVAKFLCSNEGLGYLIKSIEIMFLCISFKALTLR